MRGISSKSKIKHRFTKAFSLDWINKTILHGTCKRIIEANHKEQDFLNREKDMHLYIESEQYCLEICCTCGYDVYDSAAEGDIKNVKIIE